MISNRLKHEVIIGSPEVRAGDILIKNSRASLMIENRENSKEDYLGAEVVTIFGRARKVRQQKTWTEMAAILTRKHPALKKFVNVSTTALMLVKIERRLHVGRFQTVTEWKE